MVERAAASRVFRHAGLRGSDAPRADPVSPPRRGRRVAARSTERARAPRGFDADEGWSRWNRVCRFCNRSSSARRHFFPRLAGYDADLGVVAAYGRILPETLLQIPQARHDQRARLAAAEVPRCGARPSRGDRGRQRSPASRSCGLSRSSMPDRCCARPRGRSASTRPVSTSKRTSRRSARASCSPWSNQFAEGRVVEEPQDDALATYAPKLEKSESPIDWALPALAIHNRVRGLQPWPMASTTIQGVRYVIHRTALTDRFTDSRCRDDRGRARRPAGGRGRRRLDSSRAAAPA